jgi:hypothetical protein
MTLRSAIITGTANININGTVGATTPNTGVFTTIAGTDTTDATSTTAAAVKTAGGLAVAKKVYVGDNVVIATSGKGIDFSATAGTGTSELLAYYEEGTWTPNQGTGLTVVGAFNSSGVYTKVGRIVNIRGVLYGATSISCTSAGIMSSNLPFTPSADTAGAYFNGNLASGGQIDASSSGVHAAGAIAPTTGIYFSVTYPV